MRLAIIDPQDQVLLAWPTVREAHDQIAHKFAASVYPGRLQARRRRKLAARMVAHLLELQAETHRL